MTMVVTKKELDKIMSKVDSAAYTSLLKHEGGNLLKNAKAISGQAGFYEVELVLDHDAREWMKELGLL